MSLLAFVIQLLPAFAILSVVVSAVPPLIPHQIQSLHLHMVVNRSSDLTHIRKINSHSRSTLSKNLVGFKGGVLLQRRSSSLCYSFAHCSMQASSFYLSAVSHWWCDMGPQPCSQSTTRLVLAGSLHIIPLGK